jgi:hypothetical protein
MPVSTGSVVICAPNSGVVVLPNVIRPGGHLARAHELGQAQTIVVGVVLDHQ